jgi:hypothetical protein
VSHYAKMPRFLGMSSLKSHESHPRVLMFAKRPTLENKKKDRQEGSINKEQGAPLKHTYLDGVNGQSTRSMA